MRLFRSCLVVLAAAAVATAAQRPAGPERPDAVFRATTRLVQVDVTVVDEQGAPVPSLGAADFVLTQDGQTLPIQFATVVSGLSRGIPAASPEVARVPTRFVFFVDDYHLAFDNFERVRVAFTQFLASGIPPGTEMLVMPASFFGEKAFTFTTQPAAVQRDIEAITFDATSGSRPRRRGGALGDCDNLTNDLRSDVFSSGTMGTLSALLTALQQLDGRKAVVVLTDGLFHACRNQADAPERLRRLSDLANRSSAVLYGIHTAAFSSSASNMVDDDLIYLAERTGGIAGRSNAIGQVLDRVMADQRTYYLLAYEPPPVTFKKGRLQYREVKVTTTRPGLKVRTRGGFYNVPDASLAGR